MLDSGFCDVTSAAPYTLDVLEMDLLLVLNILADGKERTDAQIRKDANMTKSRLLMALRHGLGGGKLEKNIRRDKGTSSLRYKYSLPQPKEEKETEDEVHATANCPLPKRKVRRLYRPRPLPIDRGAGPLG